MLFGPAPNAKNRIDSVFLAKRGIDTSYWLSAMYLPYRSIPNEDERARKKGQSRKKSRQGKIVVPGDISVQIQAKGKNDWAREPFQARVSKIKMVTKLFPTTERVPLQVMVKRLGTGAIFRPKSGKSEWFTKLVLGTE